ALGGAYGSRRPDGAASAYREIKFGRGLKRSAAIGTPDPARQVGPVTEGAVHWVSAGTGTGA
ncbi:MAG TPA: hypothetical protein VFJ58_01950, partial [Armatimonadota bacterium]|nr:hypothetical protein [Armatimonadota bacterium]